MEEEPHAIGQKDASPGAEGREKAGREFILPEKLKEQGRRPVGEGRFLKIDRRLQARRDIIAGGIHGAGDGAVSPLVRFHQGGKGQRNKIQQERDEKKNE